LIVKYGLNKQDGIAIRKTEDAIQFNSTFGYRKTRFRLGIIQQIEHSIYQWFVSNTEKQSQNLFQLIFLG
jgi:hypothetical protein